MGTGHLKRAALIARALQVRGVTVELLSGGRPVPHLPFPLIQLPPVYCRADNFATLYGDDGKPVSAEWRHRRCRMLVDRCRAFAPDVLLIETFPFGRRQMRFELMPLLESLQQVRPRTLVFSSVRDVVQKRLPKRELETVSLVRRYFDGVLVHGDPGLLGFEESFAHADRIRHKIAYTGYVSDTPESRAEGPRAASGEVLVSAGGGVVGGALYQTALEARALSNYAAATWRVLVGAGYAEADFRRLKSARARGVVVERARADFPMLLAWCAVSVSQAGYNTVVDILRSGARSVLVPYAGGGETEQTVRARRLCRRGYVSLVDEAHLSPRVLARAVDRAAEMTPNRDVVDLRGADASARHLINAMSRRQAVS